MTGQHVSGLTADIEKCFNCLPRWPILAAAVHTGVPQQTLQNGPAGLWDDPTFQREGILHRRIHHQHRLA